MEDSTEDDLKHGSGSFFEEKAEVLSSICILLNTEDNSFDGKFFMLQKLLNRYQEQPALLAPHMGDLTDPLNMKLLQIVEGIDRSGNNAGSGCSGG